MFKHLVNCQQFIEELSILDLPISDNTCFFYKHNTYKRIQPEISEKNMLSILSSLENSCSLCLKSHSEAYLEPCPTSKIKLLPKIVIGV